MKLLFLLISAPIVCTSSFARRPPSRPPILGIANVRLNSANSAETTAFYRSFLGLLPTGHRPGEPEPLSFWVNDVQRIDFASTRMDQDSVPEISFMTTDAAMMRKFLKANGLRPKSLQRESPYVTYFHIQDPEGHWVAFVQRPKVYFMDLNRDPRLSRNLIHAGFIVHDRAAEDHFYKDILGFHVYWHGGMKDNETDWVDMQVPDGTDWIEYMLNVPTNADRHTLGVMNHIALGVPDIHAAEQQLLKNGMKLTEKPQIGRDGKWQLNLYDPDGTRVELMEFTPVQKPCCSDYTGPHPGPSQ